MLPRQKILIPPSLTKVHKFSSSSSSPSIVARAWNAARFHPLATMSNSTKLKPIYAALDGHQYTRAIKLAAALPATNVLGKALGAHALARSGQRHLAMIELAKILKGEEGNNFRFEELQWELDNSIEAIQKRLNAKEQPQQQPQAVPKKGNRKGGKKKPVSSPKPPMRQATEKGDSDGLEWNLIDCLDMTPSLPEEWQIAPPGISPVETDETTLGTLSVTLSNLRLPLTAFQLFSLSCQNGPSSTEGILMKAFTWGLHVLATPSKWDKLSHIRLETQTLAQMQVLALQWARLASQEGRPFQSQLATAWAAQSSLWQLQMLPPDEKRQLILSRLAESMGQRVMEMEVNCPSGEVVLLRLRTLEKQSKFAEMLKVLGNITQGISMSEFGVALTVYEQEKEKARLYEQLEQWKEARGVYEALLERSPDDWLCWQGHLQCSTKLDDENATLQLVDTVLEGRQEAKYPLRGPELMKIELLSQKLRNKQGSFEDLLTSMKSFIDTFAHKTICAFSDVEACLDLLIDVASCSHMEVLIEYSKELLQASSSKAVPGDGVSSKETSNVLRKYIFAVKVSHKMVSACPERDDLLPSISDLVTVWKSSTESDVVTEGAVTQKELKPGDDLILLAVQQMMFQKSIERSAYLAAATLLESAISHSPFNAYLKMAAIQAYYKLDAIPRAWELFETIGLKHIQLDSCTFNTLPLLCEGGLYNETIEVCNAMLRFHTSNSRDCGEYAGRAMEAGTLTKANEFLEFQRSKMINSLSLIEAKGLILDAAPVMAIFAPKKAGDTEGAMKGGLGMHQGIVGDKDDLERAINLIAESQNPCSAPSLVSVAATSKEPTTLLGTLTDNRDLSILFNEMLYKSNIVPRETTLHQSLRRGFVHGLLMRTALALDSAKGPKKGKIVQPSPSMVKRTNSLLECLHAFEAFLVQSPIEASCYAELAQIVQGLCRVFCIISAGMPSEGNDSMEQKEDRACQMLANTVLPLLKASRGKIPIASCKQVCSLLPNWIVPIFALFRMTSSICTLYGWGKRKRHSKKCAGALADVADELSNLIHDMLLTIQKLPATESPDAGSSDFLVDVDYESVLDEDSLQRTREAVVRGQNTTRMRVEPILQELDEYLDTFVVEAQ